MSDGKTQQDPSMEEILASIRRIISEDEEAATDQTPDADGDTVDGESDGGTADGDQPDAESEPESERESEVESEAGPVDEDVLELTQMVQEDGSTVDLAEGEQPR